MSCRNLAETLGPKFVASVIKLYEMERSERGEESWMAQSTQGHSSPAGMQEWMLFSLTAYIQGCRASMGEDQVHFAFMREFVEVVGEAVAEEGIFESADDFSQRARKRVTEYLSELKHSASDESLRAVARMFLANVGCESKDAALIVGAFGSFVNKAVNVKGLFDDIGKSVRLVAQ